MFSFLAKYFHCHCTLPCNEIAFLSDAEKQQGVIAASAGNHAQGVALSTQKLGIKALIVMPKTTPEIKVNSVKALGAKVVKRKNGLQIFSL
jgi:threonine dehydratase